MAKNTNIVSSLFLLLLGLLFSLGWFLSSKQSVKVVYADQSSCESQGREWCRNCNGVYTCCVKQYVCANPCGCKYENPNPQEPTPIPTTPPATFTPTPIPTSTPTPTVIASCQDIKAYSTAWATLTAADLSALKAANSIYFCARGSTNLGTFDMARFTINSVIRPDTTTKRPGTVNEFCDLYTIPAATYTFNITAQIHHTTLGWIK